MAEARKNFLGRNSFQISEKKLEDADDDDSRSFGSQDPRAEPDGPKPCFLGLDHFRFRKAPFRADQGKDGGRGILQGLFEVHRPFPLPENDSRLSLKLDREGFLEGPGGVDPGDFCPTALLGRFRDDPIPTDLPGRESPILPSGHNMPGMERDDLRYPQFRGFLEQPLKPGGFEQGSAQNDI